MVITNFCRSELGIIFFLGPGNFTRKSMQKQFGCRVGLRVFKTNSKIYLLITQRYGNNVWFDAFGFLLTQHFSLSLASLALSQFLGLPILLIDLFIRFKIALT